MDLCGATMALDLQLVSSCPKRRPEASHFATGLSLGDAGLRNGPDFTSQVSVNCPRQAAATWQSTLAGRPSFGEREEMP